MNPVPAVADPGDSGVHRSFSCHVPVYAVGPSFPLPRE